MDCLFLEEPSMAVERRFGLAVVIKAQAAPGVVHGLVLFYTKIYSLVVN